MKQGLLRLLPEHLHEAKMLYMTGVILLCILATTMGALTSPIDAVRLQCWVMTGMLILVLVLFVMGLSLHKTIHYGSMLCAAHVTLVACWSQTIYTSVQAWLFLLCVTQFYVNGRRSGTLWTVAVALSLGVSVVYDLLRVQTASIGFGETHASTSFSDYLLVTFGIAVVPWIYNLRYDRALADSQQRQRELQAKQVELEHMLQMREHFIASVSHELRTPMNAILGLNSVLLERIGDKPQARKVLEYTRQSADHLMTVINDVLDYSQFNSGKLRAHPEVFELATTVHAAFDLFRPRIENTTLTYRCEVAPGVPAWVRADRHRLMQVLVNLLGNAVKFTHQGRVVLQVRPLDGGVEFAVLDTGIGMSVSQQAGIFERYQQADANIHAQYGGSGLGLTISQRLVRMLGGRMGLESHEGVGSRFWFWLPLAEVPAPASASPVTDPQPTNSTRSLRFLVVDDHPVNRLLVRQVLQRQWPKAEVLDAADGAQALTLLQQGPRFDLVLMDMVMPVMDGIDATAAMRASPQPQLRQTPVLGLTANVSVDDLRRFRQAGLDALLLKPFEIERLCSEVLRLTNPQPVAVPAPT